jgi:single-strand DNA-binding protein
MINQVTLIGNLGRDPEIKYMPSGSAVCNFSVATTKKWKDSQSGAQKERTEWHNCAAFGKLGEICDQWLRKGSQVYIQGELRTRKWEKDGQNHYSTEIIVDEMKMLGKRPEGAGATGPHPNRRGQLPGDAKDQDGMPPAGTDSKGDDFDDDIPF